MSFQRSSSYIPSSPSRWKYDVFLSFRGEDTRKSFTDHLHSALKHRGFIIFKDDRELEKGKSISPELFKAIEESRIALIIFSKNYGSSTWCLDELVKIVQCMKRIKQIVIPIFYDVDPSIVRKQTGNFHEAFAKYEETFRNDPQKVQNWRTTLTEVANLSGWDLKHRHESEFIQDIVKEISRKLGPTTLSTLEGLVGINSRLEKLKLLVGTESDDVRMIGIYGMGGIGKTTMARVVYDSISCEFEGSSFLSNVREISRKSGIVSLQRQLLSQILRDTDINIWDVFEGIIMIRSRLSHKKVLIVLDDVDDVKQLNELSGRHDWFGLGSRIIITTRDEHLLRTHGVDNVYKAEELNNDDALQLFSLKAFKNYKPLKEYLELSKRVVKYVSGLPLALQVLGSFLFGRTVDEWESALERLNRDFDKGILDSLQISFDGLEEMEKKIFLDVACFFKGQNRDYVARILDACAFYPDIGIRVLMDKSLLTISEDNKIWMHDLLQEMGQQIVKRENLDEPGKRSRLWEEVDILHMLMENTGTEVVEGIILEKKLTSSANAKVFSKMTNLRLLKINNEQLSKSLEYLSNELRLLEWHGYALKSLPSSLQLGHIVELKMHHSCIEQLWKGIKPLHRLKVISLSHSKNLKKTPDFTMVPNLEELILKGCTSLREIHSSLLVHKKLILLNLKDCTNLKTLPREIDLESLKKLVLSGCLNLKSFPEIVRNMRCLSELFLDGTSIKELPFPIEFMEGLVFLSLKDCRNLITLPTNINVFKSLKILNLSGCFKLENVPENLGQVECLEKLDVSGTAIREPVQSIFFMKNLKELSFYGCSGPPSDPWYSRFPFSLMPRRSSGPVTLLLPSLSGLCSLRRLNLADCNLGEGAITSEVGSLASLEYLNLSNNNFVSLPASISHLSELRTLILDGCKRLQSLQELPSSLQSFDVNDCTLLKKLPESLDLPFDICGVNCWKLFKSNNAAFSMLKKMPEKEAWDTNTILPGSEIPMWFSHRSEGSSIRLKCNLDLKLRGYAVCAIFCVHKVLPGLQQERTFFLELKSKLPIYQIGRPFAVDSGQSLVDHIWLNYIPFYFDDWTPDFYDVEFEIVSQGDVPGLEVKRCAAHPIYEEEVVEYNDPVNQCSSSLSGNLIEVQQDFFASEMDVATTKRRYDGASGSGNFDDEESEPKRQRKFEFS